MTRDGKLVIDDPEIRQKLIKAIDSYTAIYRKGCTPPDSVSWDGDGNNQAFLAQTVVMTPNQSLSIPNALKRERPDDYYKNTATIEWPLGPSRRAVSDPGACSMQAVAFKAGGHCRDRQGVRPLPRRRGLAHALSRLLRRAHAAADAEAARAAVLARPERPAPHGGGDAGRARARCAYDYAAASGDWRHDAGRQERVWGKAVHRVAADGISPEQAVDEAIARIKQILSE